MSNRRRFVPFEPRTLPRQPVSAQVRIADAQDARQAARLAVTVVTDAGSQEDWEQRLMRDVSGADRILFIATGNSELLGYTRLGLVESDSPAPDGYYLLGLVVAVAHRRRGVAEALVAAAIEEAQRRTGVLWSFFDVENEASAALHAHMGFVEHARGFIGFPGLPPDSQDVLVRLPLNGDESEARVAAADGWHG